MGRIAKQNLVTTALATGVVAQREPLPRFVLAPSPVVASADSDMFNGRSIESAPTASARSPGTLHEATPNTLEVAPFGYAADDTSSGDALDLGGKRQPKRAKSDEQSNKARAGPSKPKSAGPIIAYTIADAVEVSGLSRSKLYQLFAEGVLVPRRAGGRTLVLADELQDYLRSLPPAPIRQRNPLDGK
jgi:hypothetical protein